MINVQGLTKWFEGTRGRHVILDDVNLSIEEGEFVCLLGPSGCGKSTLMNIVAGFEAPSGGTAAVAGQPILGPDRSRGVVFQAAGALFEWLTARENVELPLIARGIGLRERTEIVDHFLSLVHLKEQADKVPHEMSGGMQQRLQIARVLANSPQILLMDEPFGALDSQTRRTMQYELSQIWSQDKKTVLFITHDIDESIVLADKICVMSQGPSARIKSVYEVDMDRPRSRSDSRYQELWSQIENDIGRDAGI